MLRHWTVAGSSRRSPTPYVGSGRLAKKAEERRGNCSHLTALIAHIIFVVPIAGPATSQYEETISLLRPAVAQKLAREEVAKKSIKK
jgi:hypothetical protein